MSQYRGSPLGIKLIIALYNLFGYKAAKTLIYSVALFYAVVSHHKRQELNSYYKAVGLTPSFTSYFKHIYAFSLTIFDRFIAKEEMSDTALKVERVNLEAFETLQQTGGMLLFSHHGNWAQSFKIFHSYEIKLNIIGDEAIDENLQKLETAVDGNKRVNIISLKNGMQAMLDIARALQNNEIVIIMVDRVKEPNKTVKVDFLNRETLFHSGGFEIANMRKAPVLGCDIVRTGDQQIKIEFSEIITSSKDNKAEIIQDLAQQYARFLEKVVRKYPLQWFNFFDFWKKPGL
ncbi:MAG: lysophospholipid acyltransferase family protein [Helicobacteraceae bacterium]|jgi:predicted LPLAT superfamily acyltransferase|nr:lysophospholipid acyltransferase family protein [Helicobacteraceae bacterium]